MNPFPRVRVIRPKPPALLRLPVLFFIFAGAFALYDAANFYVPLWTQQSFPRGLAEPAGTLVDQLINGYELERQTWAMPLRDFQHDAGTCTKLKPGATDTPVVVDAADVIPFAEDIKVPPKAKDFVSFACQKDKLNLFTATLAPAADAQLHRAPHTPLGLELADGYLELKAEPNAQFQILMPNGRLLLKSQRGFRGVLSRDEQLLTLDVKDGDVSAEAQVALHFREASPAWQLKAEGGAKITFADQKPLAAGKVARILPSGMYEIP